MYIMYVRMHIVDGWIGLALSLHTSVRFDRYFRSSSVLCIVTYLLYYAGVFCIARVDCMQVDRSDEEFIGRYVYVFGK